MGAEGDSALLGATGATKAPRTARGQRTMRKILDAAREEFGERGYAESSIVGITQRAGVALGTFYTYFDSKEALFQALVRDMSNQVRDNVGPALSGAADGLDGERRALEAFLQFAREHRDIYRIIDESEFVEPAVYREHYETTAVRIAARLAAARGRGEIDRGLTDADLDVIAWGMMGANVFLGLRFAVWDESDAASVANAMNRVWRQGMNG
ncbi:TetR/AcrR family transcriptional regulator [Sphingomonas flavescens]|uniref:TetR/AcrR family transcriptional regulator n=1 Tax=Sphingomonas flavescens TaxID=3132797 RepID=UPI0028041929|nr:TetR/AcrR family transcriptional regulator [Sphingomonas limnosediminicola]